MTHDPICLVWASEFCVCPLIRLVRADEREKAVKRMSQLREYDYKKVVFHPEENVAWVERDRALAAIRGEAS